MLAKAQAIISGTAWIFDTEFLDYIFENKVASSVNEIMIILSIAPSFRCIDTENPVRQPHNSASRFSKRFINASKYRRINWYCGCEMGTSNQKTHARGPTPE